MTPLSLVSVPFQGDVVDAMQTEDGTVMVSPARVCDSLGLNWHSQLRWLQSAPWSGVAVSATPDLRGRPQVQVMIPLKVVPMWLSHVTASRVKAGLRAKLLAYQLEVVEVLSAWFLGVSDVPGLARELAAVKKRLAAPERGHIDEHGDNRVPTCRVNGMSGHCWIARAAP